MAQAKPTWAITIYTESTTDFSGRSPYHFEKAETYVKHTFGQMFNLARGFFKTRGGLSERWRKHYTTFENLHAEDFNLFNEKDFPVHIDEQWFTRKYREICHAYEFQFQRQASYDVHSEEAKRYDQYGIPYMTVYKVQDGLGRVLIETLYIQLETEKANKNAFMAG